MAIELICGVCKYILVECKPRAKYCRNRSFPTTYSMRLHHPPSISSFPFMYLRSFFIAVLKLSSRKASFRYQSHSSSSFCTLSFFWKVLGESVRESRGRHFRSKFQEGDPQTTYHKALFFAFGFFAGNQDSCVVETDFPKMESSLTVYPRKLV